jgi:hypothetical protein
MKENDSLVCPRDGGTPRCDGHPHYCPLKPHNISPYRVFVNLEGTHAPIQRLPGEIQNKIDQMGLVKIIR